MTAGGDAGELARLRRELGRRGWRPSRRLGQNLMVDANLARAIVRDAGVGLGDLVLEVGPGAGALSRPLLEAGVRLVAVEVDPRLVEVARAELAGLGPVSFLCADVLAGKHELAPEVRAALPEDGAWHLVSNLPYSVSGPLLVVLARLPGPPATMTVLVQREVAERIAARPGERSWGPLSARLSAVYGAVPGRRVPSAVFWPRPKVESQVVRLERRTPRPGPAELSRLDGALEVLFGRRRQTLGRVLASRWGRPAAQEVLRVLGLDPLRRAETLGLSELWALAERPEWDQEGPRGDGRCAR